MKVMVTGASGHLGHSLAAQLVQQGHQVVAVVRDLGKAARLGLAQPGVELLQADLRQPNVLDGAMQGVAVLFQCAANFNHWSRDPQRDIVQANDEITRNVLMSAHRAGVARVIYVSSAGVLRRFSNGEIVGPEDWAEAAHGNPYFESKLHSERLAWTIAGELGLPMLAVLPAAMVGGAVGHDTPTTRFIRSIYQGKVPFDLSCDINLVNVDDVAAAMANAVNGGDPGQRYILANESGLSVMEIARICQRHNPRLRLPRKVSKTVLLAVAWLAERVAALTGQQPALLRSQIHLYHRSTENYDISRSVRALGFKPRPALTAVDQFVSTMT